jgi:hypothetical protein
VHLGSCARSWLILLSVSASRCYGFRFSPFGPRRHSVFLSGFGAAAVVGSEQLFSVLAVAWRCNFSGFGAAAVVGSEAVVFGPCRRLALQFLRAQGLPALGLAKSTSPG